MDYPPPIDMTHYSATHRVTDSLRLRAAPVTASKLVTTMQNGTEVQVIETGYTATIEGITASWVKVITSDGHIGWCFSGFLEELKKPVNNVSVIEHYDDEFARSAKEPSPMSSWVWFAIAGSALLLSSGVVLFVKRRKNK